MFRACGLSFQQKRFVPENSGTHLLYTCSPGAEVVKSLQVLSRTSVQGLVWIALWTDINENLQQNSGAYKAHTLVSWLCPKPCKISVPYHILMWPNKRKINWKTVCSGMTHWPIPWQYKHILSLDTGYSNLCSGIDTQDLQCFQPLYIKALLWNERCCVGC